MVSTSFLSTSPLLRSLFSTSINPFIFHTKIPHVEPIRHHQHVLFKPLNLSDLDFQKNRHNKLKRVLLPLAMRESNDGDNKAMEKVLKLYESIKNKNLKDMSEIIGHDCNCLCVCNLVSTFKTFKGKKQVMEFFSSLMDTMGNKFEFVIQPTLHDGMTVGLYLKLECTKTHKPIGTGFSFHMCHTYEGNVLIRNVEMFLEPLLHIEPTTLKLMGVVASIVGQLASQAILKGEKKQKVSYVLCTLVAFAMLCIIVRNYRR